MSNSIDERVVRAKFDNAQFLQGVKDTISSLDVLKRKLDLQGATKGLENINAAAKNTTLGNIASGVDAITSRFSAMGIAGVTAITNIANRAVNAGVQLAKSLSIAPLNEGFKEYELNLNSVQTILANTQASGANLKDVNATLQELNHYADQTIYNFGQMAKNIGTFTAAGVDLKTSAASIKGIANLAALSGSNSEQASAAMYQLSQAIASGKVSLMDWNSVVNAGMGGTTFQRALAETAVAMGKLDSGSLKLSGAMKNVKIDGESFRDSISATGGKASWLTSDVLTTTLKQFTGDMKDAELAALGFSEAQIKAIQATAKTAKGAATEVKTISGLMDTTKESIVSGWAETWQVIFGDFEEAKKTFTQFGSVISNFVGENSKARIAVLQDWKALGGRSALIEAISNAFRALSSVVTPIKQAFRDIFPATTGKQLVHITKTIRNFFKHLKLGEDTAFKVRLIFQGLFAALDIGWMIIKRVVGVIKDLFGAATEGSSGILDFAVEIANWITGLRHALKYGDDLTNFFGGLKTVLLIPIELIRTLGRVLANIFSGDGIGAASGALDGLQARVAPLAKIGDFISNAWSNVTEALSEAFSFIQPFARKVGDAFSDLWDSIKDAFSSGNFSGILDLVNTGLFGGLVLMLRRFTRDGLSVDFGGGFMENLSGAFESLGGSLEALQQNIKADTLLKIAGAVALLTVSVVALSLIDSDALTKALVAITVMFVQLSGALLLFEKATSTGGVLKLPILAAGLILLSAAIGILAISVTALSKLDWQELAKGLTAVVVLIGALSGATQLMAKDSKGMITAGIGLIAVAVAVKILASAVKDFASMDWSAMAKGLTGVGAVLAALGIFTRIAEANKMGIANGAGLILLGVALKVIASAVEDFADMDWQDLGKGFAAMATALGLIAGTMNLLPKNMLLQATGLVLVAGALVVIGQALQLMGGMSWEEIAKGLVTLGGSLVIIAGAMALMSGAIPGAAALVLVAGSLAVLTPVLLALGSMSWDQIIHGLTMLAGVFTVIGVAGLLLTPVIPTLMGLSTAILLLGVGTLAAGLGLVAFSAGLTALSVAGAAGALALTAIAKAIIGLIPMALKAVGEGLVLLAGVIGSAGPTFTKAMTTLMLSLLNAIDRVAPRVIATILRLIDNLLSVIQAALPRFLQKGIDIVLSVINGITRNIPKISKAAADLIIALIKGIGAQSLNIIKAAADTILEFMNGLSQAIRDNGPAFGAAGADMLAAIVQGLVGGVGAFAGTLWNAAQQLGNQFMSSIKEFFGIASPSKEMYKIGAFVMQGFRKGLDGNADQVQAAFNNLKSMLSDSMRNMAEDIPKLEEKLKKLMAARNKDWEAIKKVRKELERTRKEYSQTSAAYRELTKNWNDDRSKLRRLANSYDKLGEKIKAANQKLADAKKTRDDYAASVKNQFSDLPDIDADETALSFATDLRKQIADTKAFATALQKLREMGLNDTLYKELLAKGPGALPFIQDLLATGKTGVAQLNGLSKELDAVAGGLGNTASKQLYQAAVDSAAGIVKGLQNQQKAIEIQMDKIADAMVNAIKRKLGIKSPSRVFMKIGKQSDEGLALGLTKYGDIVTRSAETVGHSAIESMRKSISGLSDIVDDGFSINPVITPVLDLTEVKQDARLIGDLVGAPISVRPAYESAQAAQANYNHDEQTFDPHGFVEPSKTTTVFNQYNNSPKALSDAEIYRQTKSLISAKKGEVTP